MDGHARDGISCQQRDGHARELRISCQHRDTEGHARELRISCQHGHARELRIRTDGWTR